MSAPERRLKRNTLAMQEYRESVKVPFSGEARAMDGGTARRVTQTSGTRPASSWTAAVLLVAVVIAVFSALFSALVAVAVIPVGDVTPVVVIVQADAASAILMRAPERRSSATC